MREHKDFRNGACRIYHGLTLKAVQPSSEESGCSNFSCNANTWFDARLKVAIGTLSCLCNNVTVSTSNILSYAPRDPMLSS